MNKKNNYQCSSFYNNSFNKEYGKIEITEKEIKNIFREIESENISKQKIKFPIYYEILERKIIISKENSKKINLIEITKVIENDIHLFRNPDTFFTIKVEFEYNIPVVKIVYITLKETSDMFFSNQESFLDEISKSNHSVYFSKNQLKIFGKFGLNFNEITRLLSVPITYLDSQEIDKILEKDNINIVKNTIDVGFLYDIYLPF